MNFDLNRFWNLNLPLSSVALYNLSVATRQGKLLPSQRNMMNLLNIAIAQRALLPRRRQHAERSPRSGYQNEAPPRTSDKSQQKGTDSEHDVDIVVDAEPHGDVEGGGPTWNRLASGDRLYDEMQRQQQTALDQQDTKVESPGAEHARTTAESIDQAAASPTLLLSPEVLAGIARAINARRSYRAWEIWAEELEIENNKAELFVSSELNQKKHMLIGYREGFEIDDDPEMQKQKMVDLEIDIKVLERMISEIHDTETGIDKRLQFKTDSFRKMQTAVMALIEEAIPAGQLPTPRRTHKPEVWKYDIDYQFEKNHRILYPSEWPALEPVPEEEALVESEQNRVLAVYYGLRTELDRAQQWLDTKQEHHDQEWNDHCVAESSGQETPHSSKEDFEKYWEGIERYADCRVENAKKHVPAVEQALIDTGSDVTVARQCGSKVEYWALMKGDPTMRDLKQPDAETEGQWEGDEDDDGDWGEDYEEDWAEDYEDFEYDYQEEVEYDYADWKFEGGEAEGEHS